MSNHQPERRTESTRKAANSALAEENFTGLERNLVQNLNNSNSIGKGERLDHKEKNEDFQNHRHDIRKT